MPNDKIFNLNVVEQNDQDLRNTHSMKQIMNVESDESDDGMMGLPAAINNQRRKSWLLLLNKNNIEILSEYERNKNKNKFKLESVEEKEKHIFLAVGNNNIDPYLLF